MKKILITGANGQLGRALDMEYKEEDVQFIRTDVAESEGITALDITRIEDVLSLVSLKQPDVIINCAAHTNVDKCETQEDLAYKINAIGARNLSIAAQKADAKLIQVSTDYVFSGDASEPITEFDTPGPVSAYGRTKYAGEEFVKEFSNRHFILRTAWLYGDGHNFVKTMLKLAETHDTLSVVKDQLGSPTSATELARLIHYLEPTENYGTYHATCEGMCSWAEFADAIFARAKKDVKVTHVTTQEYRSMNPQSAKRPAYSVLDNYMLRLTGDYRMSSWQAALDEYMETLLG
ncbi:MAG: dTDP-4-dehydrorhamnose reductase [Lachnospiraceae bacterium]|nr:dTDP-4-dehydrorhamnose reductase [Lachnospiraceae bacterium]